MFKKVHFRLTLMCGGITTLILVIMTLGYLYISEKNLKDTQLLSFRNNMNTVTANLEQQSVITHEWLSKLEDNGKYMIFLMDNDIPFLFNSRSTHADVEELYTAAFAYYRNSFSIEMTAPSLYHSIHTEFIFSSASKEEYYASVITLEKGKNILQMLVLSPLTPVKEQLFNQRLLFLGIISFVLIILWILSYAFTKILLRPIEENRKNQIQFVASASHELRTPLAVILSCLESFKQAPENKKETFLNIIESESRRMSTLVDDMLDLSRSDNHSFSIEKESVELDTLLLNSYEAFEPMAKEKNLTLSIYLPEAALPLCICDRNRIRQVTAILLHNAVSYTPAGGTVSLSLHLKKKHFFITVIDTGIGIPDDEKEKIFHRFYRSEKSRSAKGHFGLGLCIASEIVKAHNGTIEVIDTPGGGSTFKVRLPVL
ncbi:signal transduction histidine kinase [Kineothrix alysoides]|uniref:histidine kinase n=1 Tax=Kineothrix alysoides TaxID=1469948 RepID=A0A4R1QLG8_9FIRM|nr:HAMP domain-containing sensor histidine kinase [Kineothrix alysoides]TCL54476.1 signal transduction histidine kinase [Kineothrix alysoides]